MPETRYHTYPGFLLRNPRLIYPAYAFNRLVLQRNWQVARHFSKALKNGPQTILDAGCGEGMHLFSALSRHREKQFTGLDHQAANIAFCKRLAQARADENVEFEAGALETLDAREQYDLVLSVGVLQYIAQDELALANLHAALRTGGKLLLYCPVNERHILPFYTRLYHAGKNYEQSQGRVRVYTETELRKKLEAAGFSIDQWKKVMGSPGILAHDVLSLLLAQIVNGSFLPRLLSALLLPVLLPLILLLNALDLWVPVRKNNAAVVLASKITSKT